MLFEVFKLLSTALSIYSWALIIYILMSWFQVRGKVESVSSLEKLPNRI